MTIAESAEPGVRGNAPTDCKSAAVAFRYVAATGEVPATGSLLHPALLAIRTEFWSNTLISGLVTAPEMLKGGGISAGPTPLIRTCTGLVPWITKPGIASAAPVPT